MTGQVTYVITTYLNHHIKFDFMNYYSAVVEIQSCHNSIFKVCPKNLISVECLSLCPSHPFQNKGSLWSKIRGRTFILESTVMSIYRLHILRYIAVLPIIRTKETLLPKQIFKMSIRTPYSSHKLFRFVHRRFEQKLPRFSEKIAVIKNQ